jgi:hypothetical protein
MDNPRKSLKCRSCRHPVWLRMTTERETFDTEGDVVKDPYIDVQWRCKQCGKKCLRDQQKVLDALYSEHLTGPEQLLQSA